MNKCLKQMRTYNLAVMLFTNTAMICQYLWTAEEKTSQAMLGFMVCLYVKEGE